MLTQTELHAKRHERTMVSRTKAARRAHTFSAHEISRPRARYAMDEDTLLSRIWKRKEEREAEVAEAQREMARIRGTSKPSLFARLKTIFRRTP
jgi:hypothetical protein